MISAEPYWFPLRRDLSPATTALLVIDMQGDFCSAGGFIDRIGQPYAALRAPLAAIATLLDLFRRGGFRVFHTRETYRPDLADAQPNRLWRGAEGRNAVVGDAGPLGRFLVAGEPGWQIVPEVAPHAGEVVFDKPSYGAFATTAIDATLKASGIGNLVVCGVTSDCCVRATVVEALDRGYDCLTVSDASAATSAERHHDLMRQIATRGGVFGAVTTTRAVVDALQT